VAKAGGRGEQSYSLIALSEGVQGWVGALGVVGDQKFHFVLGEVPGGFGDEFGNGRALLQARKHD